MQDTQTRFLRFSELNEMQKAGAMHFFNLKILPGLLEREYEIVRKAALENGLIIKIDIFAAEGYFDLSIDEVLSKIDKSGLIDKNDSKYNFHKKMYNNFKQEFLDVMEEVMRLFEKDEDDQAVLYFENLRKRFKRWKEELLYFILNNGYLKLVRGIYRDYTSEEFIEKFFNTNDYVFSESGDVYIVEGENVVCRVS